MRKLWLLALIPIAVLCVMCIRVGAAGVGEGLLATSQSAVDVYSSLSGGEWLNDDSRCNPDDLDVTLDTTSWPIGTKCTIRKPSGTTIISFPNWAASWHFIGGLALLGDCLVGLIGCLIWLLKATRDLLRRGHPDPAPATESEFGTLLASNTTQVMMSRKTAKRVFGAASPGPVAPGDEPGDR